MHPAAPAMIAELESEAAATRRVLERVPLDRAEWRPHARSMSLGQLARHVATLPGAIAKMADLDTLDAATIDSRPPPAVSTDELLAIHDEGVAFARRYLETLSEERAGQPWKLTRGDRVLFSVPRIDLLRMLAFNHVYHHRGQLTVYLRLLDVAVPSVYGPTADENPFAPEAAAEA
jgi:uncharacterized damage-inducible protein DinB